MQRRKDDQDSKETADQLISFSYRTLYVVIFTVVATIMTASLGYFNLNATASEALTLASKHEQILNYMACDVRQLKNYMIYGIRPHASDLCPKDTGR